MIRYIPAFILQHYEANIFQGSLEAYVLLFDIADFTKIGSSFQVEGKKGAEELSRFLEVVFAEPIRLVEEYGGFVSVFAGDAFCAIFPEHRGKSIVSCVDTICRHFRENRIYKTVLGDINLQVRQTVCYGTLDWRIFQNSFQNEYVFQGKVMREVGELSLQKAEVIWSQSAASRIGLECFMPIGDGFNLLSMADTVAADKAEPGPLEADKQKAQALEDEAGGSGVRSSSVGCHIDLADSQAFAGKLQFDHRPESIKRFCHPRFHDIEMENQIRTGAFCFACLEGVPEANREENIAGLHIVAEKFGGYVNKLDDTDKGLVALLIFGLPFNDGKTLERICSFSLEIVQRIPEIALGISCGNVFAGYIGKEEVKEYTAFGYPLNLASRLMSKARAGEVLTDTFLWQEMNAKYEFDYLGSVNLKGITLPMRYYQLHLKTKESAWHVASRFVGRDVELLSIRTIIDECVAEGKNAIIYVSGDAGIGKSRLVTEALATYWGESYHKFTVSCDAIMPRPLAAIRQIVRAFSYYNPAFPVEAGIAMFKGLWMTLAQDDPELQRIESILAWLIGYEWEGSIWSILPKEEKPRQLRNAFISFIRQLAKNKPVLIHLDDSQWLGEESKVYLQRLSRDAIAPVIIVTSCRYLENGEKVDLNLIGHKRYDLELSSLSDNGSIELAKTSLRIDHIPDETLELIITRAMGNPLFIEQLTTYLMESSIINDKGIIIGEIGYLSSFSISDILSSRIDRLSNKVRECVFNASVLGTEFCINVLAQMLMDVPTVELAIGIKNRIWKELDALHYTFTHIMIKDLIYQHMMSDKLHELHKNAAEAMEIVYAAQLDDYAVEIAMHFQKGDEIQKAAFYFNKAGSAFRDKYDFSGGILNLNKALQIRETILGAEHVETADSLSNLAALYMAQGTFEQAEPLYLRVLEIAQTNLGAEHPDIIPPLNKLATLYMIQGKYDDAEPLNLRALKIKEKALGLGHPDTAASLLNLAHLLWLQGKYDQAEPYYQKATRIYEALILAKGILPANGKTPANTGSKKVFSPGKALKPHSKTTSIYQKDLQIREIVHGTDRPDDAGLLTTLASLYWLQGNYDGAASLYQKVLDIREHEMGPDHPETAKALNNLATFYDSHDLFDLAEPLYQRSLLIRQKTLGNEQLLTAQSMQNLADLYDSRDNSGEAEPLYLEALRIRENVLGGEHPLTAESLNNLARFYDDHGKPDDAERLYLRALDIREKVLGAGQPNLVTSMNTLADLYSYQGRYNKAEQLFQRALKVWEKVVDSGHPTLAKSMNNLALFYSSQGLYDEAEQLYQRALKTWEKVMDTEHPQILKSVKGLVELYEKTGETAKAQIYRDRLANIQNETEE